MYISYTHIVIGAAPLLIHIQQTGDFQVNQFPAPQQISAFFPGVSTQKISHVVA